MSGNHQRNDIMKVGRWFILTLTCAVTVVLLAGCDPSDTTATTQRFTLRIVDLSNKPIASGHLLLPCNIEEASQFTGSYEIVVTELPEKPSTQHDYAILCLSKNEGQFSASVRDRTIRMNLHPQVDDSNVYLEGTLNADLFKGTCLYQSYYGYEPFGTFKAEASALNGVTVRR